MKLIQYWCILLALVSTTAWSQNSDSWDWKIAPYLWTVGISGDLTIGDISQDLDISFSDILSDFEVGGSVFSEFGKGNHAVHFDYTYIRLRPDPMAVPTASEPPPQQAAKKGGVGRGVMRGAAVGAIVIFRRLHGVVRSRGSL